MRRLLALAGLAAAAALPSPAAAAVQPPPAAAALQKQLIAVVQRDNASVVQIETSSGLGSGVVFDKQGHIVTNAHVVEDAQTVKVTLANGKRYAGKVVNSFPPNDLAVVKISAPNLRPIVIADSSKLKVGQFAIALGNPLGLRSSVTFGIVSALNRTVSEGGGITIPNTVQTSAPINPGNSGGALVDLQGRLIGIPTLAANDPQVGGQAIGIGFAIPSNTVKDLAGQIIKHGKVVDSHRAFLGITPGDTNGQGVYVGEVVAGTPAAKAGLQQGDIIRSIAGRVTPDSSTLSEVLARLKPGQTVSVVYVTPDGAQKTVRLTLGSYPGS